VVVACEDEAGTLGTISMSRVEADRYLDPWQG
jgi:hypothetical protein